MPARLECSHFRPVSFGHTSCITTPCQAVNYSCCNVEGETDSNLKRCDWLHLQLLLCDCCLACALPEHNINLGPLLICPPCESLGKLSTLSTTWISIATVTTAQRQRYQLLRSPAHSSLGLPVATMVMPFGRDINSSTSGASGPASRKRFIIRPFNEVFTCLDRKAVPQSQSLLQRLCLCIATKVLRGQLRDRCDPDLLINCAQQFALHCAVHNRCQLAKYLACRQVPGLQMF